MTPQERAFTDELLARLAQAEQLGIAQKRLAADAAQYGGPACARNLLRRRQLSEGFFALRAAGRLDLSLEALVTAGKHGALFTDQEVNACLEALLEAGYYGTR